MSQATATPTSSTSNFRTIFVQALEKYREKTKTDLITHPLATQLQSCNSSSDILAFLHDKVKEFEKSRTQNEKLSRWLNPTINVLYAFSATLGGGVGLVGLNVIEYPTDQTIIVFADILTRKRNLCRCWGALHGEYSHFRMEGSSH